MSDETKASAQELLTRREALRRVAAVLGGTALIGQAAFLAGCSTNVAVSRTGAALFVPSDVALLDEIADTILPDTATPGAKAAGVGPFIVTMVADTYGRAQQRLFRDGLASIDRECRRDHGAGFIEATPQQRLALLERLDREQFAGGGFDRRGQIHYFRLIKELTLLGYFTSEIGYTRALRYAETPGRYEPCVEYRPGDKAWASHA